METALLVVGLLGLAFAALFTVGIGVWAILRLRAASAQRQDDQRAALAEAMAGPRKRSAEVADELHILPRIAALEVKVAGLPSLWAEERKRVERAAESARKSESRARRIAEASEPEPESDPQLFDEHEGSGPGRGVRPMHADMAGGGEPQQDPVSAARAALAGAMLNPMLGKH